MKTYLYIPALLAALLTSAALHAGDLDPTPDEARKLRSLRRLKGTIVWGSNRGGDWDIYASPLDMPDIKKLTNKRGADLRPRFSPDGKRILFIREARATDPKAKHKWDVWTMNPDGAGQKRIVTDGAMPAWAPDGKSVVFVRDQKVWRHDLGADYRPTLVIDTTRKPLNGREVYLPAIDRRSRRLAVTTSLDKNPRVHLVTLELDKEKIVFTDKGQQIAWDNEAEFVYWIAPEGKGRRSIVTHYPDTGARGKLVDLPEPWTVEDSPRLVGNNGWVAMAVGATKGNVGRGNYELFLWQRGHDPEDAIRLTFDRSVDQTPDVWMGK